MVQWIRCLSCGKPVDEGENKCYYCGDKETPKRLKDLIEEDYKDLKK